MPWPSRAKPTTSPYMTQEKEWLPPPLAPRGFALPPADEDDELQPLNELEAELAPVVGPKCVPMTPIMRYAMAEVVAEVAMAG